MGFPRQEYWSRLPLPSPGDLPGVKSALLCHLHWQADSLPLALWARSTHSVCLGSGGFPRVTPPEMAFLLHGCHPVWLRHMDRLPGDCAHPEHATPFLFQAIAWTRLDMTSHSPPFGTWCPAKSWRERFTDRYPQPACCWLLAPLLPPRTRPHFPWCQQGHVHVLRHQAPLRLMGL